MIQDFNHCILIHCTLVFLLKPYLYIYTFTHILDLLHCYLWVSIIFFIQFCLNKIINDDLKSFYNLRNNRKCIPYISSLITFDMDETNFLLWSTFNLPSFVFLKYTWQRMFCTFSVRLTHLVNGTAFYNYILYCGFVHFRR